MSLKSRLDRLERMAPKPPAASETAKEPPDYNPAIRLLTDDELDALIVAWEHAEAGQEPTEADWAADAAWARCCKECGIPWPA